MVYVAVALLAERGELRLSRDGRWHTVSLPPGGTRHPVEEAVLEAARRLRTFELSELVKRMWGDGVFARQKARLARLGLLVPDAAYTYGKVMVRRLDRLARVAHWGPSASPRSVS